MSNITEILNYAVNHGHHVHAARIVRKYHIELSQNRDKLNEGAEETLDVYLNDFIKS